MAASEADGDRPPLVSVVLATHGGDSPAFLREALRSILEQTHTSLELLIVLDGPVSEPARAFVEAVAETDARVRLITLPANRGPARARNAGIGAARGEYIAILDADDVAAPERVAKQVAFVRATEADVAGSFYA
ncbi:MAG TPA: glycosyltransferase family 2 protein, partial [Candidatus Hydrogenedentes bacterium]|nr:glycosyltransferase family 2 protein [Candidatus Hydrogenedentota bacterium]